MLALCIAFVFLPHMHVAIFPLPLSFTCLSHLSHFVPVCTTCPLSHITCSLLFSLTASPSHTCSTYTFSSPHSLFLFHTYIHTPPFPICIHIPDPPERRKGERRKGDRGTREEKIWASGGGKEGVVRWTAAAAVIRNPTCNSCMTFFCLRGMCLPFSSWQWDLFFISAHAFSSHIIFSPHLLTHCMLPSCRPPYQGTAPAFTGVLAETAASCIFSLPNPAGIHACLPCLPRASPQPTCFLHAFSPFPCLLL